MRLTARIYKSTLFVKLYGIVLLVYFQVLLPTPIKNRFWHTITATDLGPGLSEVLVFGGCMEWPEKNLSLMPISETELLNFGE